MKDLSEYPNLERYYRHFIDADGRPERAGSLPFLIVWIRLLAEPEDESGWIDPVAFFGLEGDDALDFRCWGRGSRWQNVFWRFAKRNISLVKEKCLELAEKHGDPNVEEHLDS